MRKMRKLTVLLLVLLLTLSAALAETPPDGKRDLGFTMLDSLYVEGQNRIISPASAQYALSMAALGAKGDTLAELLAALGAASTDDLTAQVAEGISCANIAFVAPEIALNADYEAALRDRCGAEIDAIDDEIVARANDWVREKTNGLIDGILNEQPSADTGLILMNAIAMDEEWALPFKASDTQQASFMAASGEVPVDMMCQTNSFLYWEAGGAQIIRLPYAQDGLEMWIAMPQTGDMRKLLDALALQGVDGLRSGAKERRVALMLPKMDISDTNSLNEALRTFGVNAAFGDSADFSGISSTPMYISKIEQKARVQLDEDGTRAAAVTSSILATALVREEEPAVEMTVNRPFAFVICDETTAYFVGVVENPQPD